MAYVLTVNPSSHSGRRKKKGKRKHARAVRRNPANPVHRKRRASRRPHAKRRFRRNPSALAGFGLNQVTGQFLPVALGAGGALLTDIAIDKLPIPIDFKIGNKRHLAKAGVAIGLGLITGKVMGRDKGARVMAGALTVVAYDFLKQMLQKQLAPVAMPATVQGMGYYPELEYENGNDMGLLMDNGVGDGDFDGSGFDEAGDFAGMGEVLDY